MNNLKISEFKKEKGISMITLVVTIIVIIILAAIVYSASTRSLDDASRSNFAQELKDVEIRVSSTRLMNQTEGTGEEIKNKGFYKSYVQNPPETFVSFSEDSVYGYVVNMELITFENNPRGLEYPKYSGDVENNLVVFGRDDVYIYDAEGKVFYAKGYEVDGGKYYTVADLEANGPEIVSVNKTLSMDEKSVLIEIVVKKISSGDLIVIVGDTAANKVGGDGDTETFECTVYENKTYIIRASETGAGTSSTTVDVTEINAETYTISYDANGGENPPADSIKTEGVIMRLSEEVPTRDNYIFIGWDTNPTATIPTYRSNSEFFLDEDTVLYAIWSKEDNRTYSLSYSANGGDGAPSMVTNVSGEVIISNVTPRREGFAFDGWSLSANATTGEYHAGETINVTSNIILYAIWQKGMNTLSLSIEPVGYGTVNGAGAKNPGSVVVISAIANEGYRFKNWEVTAGNVSLGNINSATTSLEMPNTDVTIVAMFEAKKFNVKYDANSGVGAPTEVSVNYGDTINITSIIPTREGYDFLGWSLDENAIAADFVDGDTFNITGDVVFYAVWTSHINVYHIKYDLNGGDGNFVEQTKVQGGTTILHSHEPTRTDLIFDGWSFSSTSKNVVYRPGDIYNRDADVILYAVWRDEVAPTVMVTPMQSGDSLMLIASGHDEGIIAEYAWTKTNAVPTIWESLQENVNVSVINEVLENGTYYIWFRDLAGNYANANIRTYEIIYDANGGSGGISKQYKADVLPMTITSQTPDREEYIFLGWSLLTEPAENESSVNYIPGSYYVNNSDTKLTAVWGRTAFELSKNLVRTAVDEESTDITVIKSPYTGDITVSSADEEIATAEINGNVITITPGTKIGVVDVTVTESRKGNTKTIEVILNKGIRELTLTETSKNFIYGDNVGTIGFSYAGNASTETVKSLNENVATVVIRGKNIDITPKNVGETIISFEIAEDDMYFIKKTEIKVTVNKKEIIVTPDDGQGKVYDGTNSTPILTYTYDGVMNGETPGFTGQLTREAVAAVGDYEIKIGTLALVNNGSFKKDNYYLTLSTNKKYFKITPKPTTMPTAITGQIYDGTVKYGIPEGEYYIREGNYSKVNAGTYTAIATLKDPHNYMWTDGTNASLNIVWKIETRSIATTNSVVIQGISPVVYTGYAITPQVIVRDNVLNKVLTKDSDYTVSYSNNVNVGTATVTITGRNNYAGTNSTTFRIDKANMQVEVSGYSGVYDNAAHGITVTSKWPTTGSTIYYSTSQLTSSNYTMGTTTPIKYTNIVSTTTYFYITNPNFHDYYGSATVIISPKSILNNIVLSNVSDISYTGSNIVQYPVLQDQDLSRRLVENTDYTVAHSNNLNVGTATITMTGRGNYTGTRTTTFNIKPDVISIRKSTESYVTSLTVTITKSIPVTTLQYSYNNSSWTNYTGALTITSDCTIYARSVHNGKVIGTAQITISNICEHSYTSATCTSGSYCRYCGKYGSGALGHDYEISQESSATCTRAATYRKTCTRCGNSYTYTSGSSTGHNMSRWYYHSRTQHKRTCTNCGGNAEYGSHTTGSWTCRVCNGISMN